MNREKINAYEIPNSYDLRFADISELFNEAAEKGTPGAFYDAIYTAYKYGFIRGGNQIKNTRKAKREALNNG